jgi:hypothetical protein
MLTLTILKSGLIVTGKYAYANDFKVRLKALTDLAKE